MRSILKDLWNGNLEPWSEEWEREREARELVGLRERHKEALQKALDETGKEILSKYEDCYTELESLGCEEAFSKGFSLGVKLVAQALIK
ncbi:MAG: hypothetical protein E7636_06585 [Ruminococcaceae bacterium]|nr:hypothetical protein [Oscillospiraceae bacterium]